MGLLAVIWVNLHAAALLAIAIAGASAVLLFLGRRGPSWRYAAAAAVAAARPARPRFTALAGSVRGAPGPAGAVRLHVREHPGHLGRDLSASEADRTAGRSRRGGLRRVRHLHRRRTRDAATGQPTGFILLGLAIVVRARRPWLAGVGFLLAATTLQTGLPLALALLVLGGWPVVWRGITLVLACSVPAVALAIARGQASADSSPPT